VTSGRGSGFLTNGTKSNKYTIPLCFNLVDNVNNSIPLGWGFPLINLRIQIPS